MTFIGDYRPTKRVGIEELDGAIRLARQRIDQTYEDADARQHYYEGLWLGLRIIRSGRFEYPHEFMAVFENNLDSYTSGDGLWGIYSEGGD